MMNTLFKNRSKDSRAVWIRETAFGRWFLGTSIWYRYVLMEAVRTFDRLLGENRREVNRLLDAGCGVGLAFPLLEQYFSPNSIVGVDIDDELIETAINASRKSESKVDLVTGSVADLDYPEQSFDMIFCHQLLHHINDQERVLEHFHRLLVPGGILLIGESCRRFIQSLPVRALFRHPMKAQKSATEYIDLVESIGFKVDEREVQIFTPWWSRWDLGLLDKLRASAVNPSEATEVLIVARKSAE